MAMIEYLALVLPVVSTGVALMALLVACTLKDEVERLHGEVYDMQMAQIERRRGERR